MSFCFACFPTLRKKNLRLCFFASCGFDAVSLSNLTVSPHPVWFLASVLAGSTGTAYSGALFRLPLLLPPATATVWGYVSWGPPQPTAAVPVGGKEGEHLFLKNCGMGGRESLKRRCERRQKGRKTGRDRRVWVKWPQCVTLVDLVNQLQKIKDRYFCLSGHPHFPQPFPSRVQNVNTAQTKSLTQRRSNVSFSNLSSCPHVHRTNPTLCFTLQCWSRDREQLPAAHSEVFQKEKVHVVCKWSKDPICLLIGS